MKGYKGFLGAFAIVMALYIIAEWNRPKPLDWSVTLSNQDKNPYGGHIVYHRLKDLFPHASIASYRLPIYNQVNNFRGSNTAYILIDPELDLTGEDVEELFDYVVTGNFVFLSSASVGKALADSLKVGIYRRYASANENAVGINFINPFLRSGKRYSFKPMPLNNYLDKIDTAKAVALGDNHSGSINFVKIPYGRGAFFIHTLPICFSNYFMVTGNNAEYAAKALSYLPGNVSKIFWDEYYKLGPTGSQNPLRFVLNTPSLRWAFRIGLLTMILFILFERKRRQRVIPVIAPFRNSTIDFVETVGNVYFNQRDNKDIAAKKISYFLEFIRSVLYLSTSHLNGDFIQALANKAAVPELEVARLLDLIRTVQHVDQVSDSLLIKLNREIDLFYNKVK